jgi:dTMP kinase
MTRLIAIAGVDGSGKSTQVHRLVASLNDGGVTAQPYKVNHLASCGFMWLAERMTGDPFQYHPLVPSTLREFTVATDVVRCYFQEVHPLVSAGVLVVWDRSPLCYRAYMRAYGADTTWPEALIGLVPEPDLTVLLDVEPDVAMARLVERDGAVRADHTRPLLRRAVAAYRGLASESPRVVVVDGSRAEDDVAEAIDRLVRPRSEATAATATAAGRP